MEQDALKLGLLLVRESLLTVALREFDIYFIKFSDYRKVEGRVIIGF